MLDEIRLADQMALSTRTRNALDNAGIVSLHHLATRDKNELLRLPNFGQLGLHEVKDLLAAHGLRLKQESLPMSYEDLSSIEHLAVVERLDRIERLLLKILDGGVTVRKHPDPIGLCVSLAENDSHGTQNGHAPTDPLNLAPKGQSDAH